MSFDLTLRSIGSIKSAKNINVFVTICWWQMVTAALDTMLQPHGADGGNQKYHFTIS